MPFSRLVGPLCKARDTRAGFWLLFGIGLLVVLMLGAATIITLVNTEAILFSDFTAIAAYMTSFLLPILAIMLVTSEWSQRTALVTFTLVCRSRVALASLSSPSSSPCSPSPWRSPSVRCALGHSCALCSRTRRAGALGLGDMAGWLVTQTLTMLGGFALATLLLNTPAAIVAFLVYKYVLPGVFALAASLGGAIETVVRWVDFQGAQGDVYEWSMTEVPPGRTWSSPDCCGWRCRWPWECGGILHAEVQAHATEPGRFDYRLAAAGREAEEDERLDLLEQIFDPMSQQRRSLVQPGWRCLEVGAGRGLDGRSGWPLRSGRPATWSRADLDTPLPVEVRACRTSRCVREQHPR